MYEDTTLLHNEKILILICMELRVYLPMMLSTTYTIISAIIFLSIDARLLPEQISNGPEKFNIPNFKPSLEPAYSFGSPLSPPSVESLPPHPPPLATAPPSLYPPSNQSSPNNFASPPPVVRSPPPQKKPQYAVWCVAKPTVPSTVIQSALDYACGSGADCKSIQPNGSCFQPNTLVAHASFAFNSYWQKNKAAGGTCDFGGTAMLVTTDPSYNNCNFILI